MARAPRAQKPRGGSRPTGAKATRWLAPHGAKATEWRGVPRGRLAQTDEARQRRAFSFPGQDFAIVAPDFESFVCRLQDEEDRL